MAQSFESIHRSNLIGMGVIPLLFEQGQDPKTLGLTGDEIISIPQLNNSIKPFQEMDVTIEKAGQKKIIKATLAIETGLEIEYLRHGGILPYVLGQFLEG